MKKRLFAFMIMLLVVLVPLASFADLDRTVITRQSVQVSMPDLSFSTTTLDGKAYSSSVIKNYDLIMVNCWGEWCGACTWEMPYLQKISQNYKNVLILGVWYGNSEASALSVAKENGVTYPLLHPAGMLADCLWASNSFPHTIFFDSKGKQVGDMEVGATNYEGWEKIIKGKMALLSPRITTQPKSVTVAVNATAKFTVAASGSDLKYQWQWSADNGKTWTNSSSATTGYNTTTLQVTATTARNGYKYRCKVSNSGGTATSSVATLTASNKPTITTQPKSVTAYVGKAATFKVVATSASSYQWQWSADGGSTWTNSSSATTGYNTATLQVSATAARNGYKYRCKVSNNTGTTTSSAATLTVSEKPVITTQPKNVTASPSGTTAKFTVAAVGATKYQWQWSADNGSTWTNSSSATTGYNKDTLQVTATDARNGYKYRCKVSNSAGTTTSSAATLTVNSKPTITTQPNSVTAYVGKTATFKVVATSASSYQWQWSADGGSTWTNSSSATTGYNSAILQVSATAERNGYKYRCKVSNNIGTTTSSAATLTVSEKPVITTQPKNVTTSADTTAEFTVSFEGGTKYQWQRSTDNGKTWTNTGSAATSDITRHYTVTLKVSATTASNGYKYRCKVSNSVGTTTSSVVTLTVK